MYGQAAKEAEIVCVGTIRSTGQVVYSRVVGDVHDMTASTFPEMVRRIFRQQITAFKINLSFGFILRNDWMVQGMEVSSSLQVCRAEPGDGACFPFY
jgi:hypothetical protein